MIIIMTTTVQVTQPDANLLTKWKIRTNSIFSPSTVLCLLQKKDGSQVPVTVPFYGRVVNIMVKEGAQVQKGDSLLKYTLCEHEIVMKDMCAVCGANLRKQHGFPGERVTESQAKIAMVHNIPELHVSESKALELANEDEKSLTGDRKLVLLVDLDQTLIHTTVQDVAQNIEGVHHFQLHGHGPAWYHTRLRRHTQRFLERMSELYELHIFTFANRMYAHQIADILDPKKRFFSHRILSRDEAFDPKTKTANLKALFPLGDKMVCIIDDRDEVWRSAPNLVLVKPYRFFPETGDINAPTPESIPSTSRKTDSSTSGQTYTSKSGKSDTSTSEKTDTSKSGKTDPSTSGKTDPSTSRKPDSSKSGKPDSSKSGKTDPSTSVESDGLISGDCDPGKSAKIDPTASGKTDSSESENSADSVIGDSVASILGESVPSTISESVGSTVDETVPFTETGASTGDSERQRNTGDDQVTGTPVIDAAKIGDSERQRNTGDDQVTGTPVIDTAKIGDDAPKDVNDKEKKDAKKSNASKNDEVVKAPPLFGSAEYKADDADDYLLDLENILTRIHTEYYREFDAMQSRKKKTNTSGSARKAPRASDLPDMKVVMPRVRRSVLSGCRLVISGLVPLGCSLQDSEAGMIAKALGAELQTDLVLPGKNVENCTTHVIACNSGTKKVKQALYQGKSQTSHLLHVVNPNWLWQSYYLWRRLPEEDFPLSRDFEPKEFGTGRPQDLGRKRGPQGSAGDGPHRKKRQTCDTDDKPKRTRKRGKDAEANMMEEDIDADDESEECEGVDMMTEDDYANEMAAHLPQPLPLELATNPLMRMEPDAALKMLEEVDAFVGENPEIDEEDDDDDDDDDDEDSDNNTMQKKFTKKTIFGTDTSESDCSMSADFPKGWSPRRSSDRAASCHSEEDEQREWRTCPEGYDYRDAEKTRRVLKTGVSSSESDDSDSDNEKMNGMGDETDDDEEDDDELNDKEYDALMAYM